MMPLCHLTLKAPKLLQADYPLQIKSLGDHIKRRRLDLKILGYFPNVFNLAYSRVEVAADARHKVCSCGIPPQMPCNEADAVRSARLKGKLGRHKMEVVQKKSCPICWRAYFYNLLIQKNKSDGVGIIYE